MGKTRIICAGSIINQENKILLQLRDDNQNIDDPSIWTFPGGEKEKDETIDEALVREIYEETNLKVESAQLLCRMQIKEDKVVYFFRIFVKNFEDIQCNEGQDLKFFSKDELHDIPKYQYFYNFYNLI
jgi:mutator protein MutT